MATDLVIPVRDKKSGKWRIVGIHVESDQYFGMILEDEYEQLQEAATRSLAMQIELKKAFQPEETREGATLNRKQRRAMMSEAKKV